MEYWGRFPCSSCLFPAPMLIPPELDPSCPPCCIPGLSSIISSSWPPLQILIDGAIGFYVTNFSLQMKTYLFLYSLRIIYPIINSNKRLNCLYKIKSLNLYSIALEFRPLRRCGGKKAGKLAEVITGVSRSVLVHGCHQTHNKKIC